MLDIVISGGDVVDGTGGPAYRADVGIREERIACIGDLSQVVAARVIDAKGLTVSPGFIDTHTHSEGDLLVGPATRLWPSPGHHYRVSRHRRHVVRTAVSRQLSGVPPVAEGAARRAPGGPRHEQRRGVPRELPREGVHQHRLSGTERYGTLGRRRDFETCRLPETSWRGTKDLVREGIEQGAVGFSTGSSYYPGPWTSTDELVEICELVRDIGRRLHGRAAPGEPGASVRRRRCPRGIGDWQAVGRQAPFRPLPHGPSHGGEGQGEHGADRRGQV